MAGKDDMTRARAASAADRASIDAQVDQLIEDIEATSSFSLRKQPDAEVFDPGDIHVEDLSGTGDVPVIGESAVMETVDEVADAFSIPEAEELEEERIEEEEQEEEDAEERSARHRRRLRRILIFAFLILACIGAAIGVFVWRNTLSPNLPASGTDELVSSSAGQSSVIFNAISSDSIPHLLKVQGKSVKDAKAALGSSVKFESKVGKSSDARVKSLVKMLEGTVTDANGTKIADVGLGLNKKGKVVYSYCLFDLDALSVADAEFSELARSNVIPASLLSALGMGSDAVEAATLSVDGDADADQGADAKQEAKFQGSTGVKSPASWAVTETYDYSVGQTLGDNSVVRTLLAEFY